MKEEVQQQFPDKSIHVEWMLLDLASFRSTKEFTVAFREKSLPLHILINNAGVGLLPRGEINYNIILIIIPHYVNSLNYVR